MNWTKIASFLIGALLLNAKGQNDYTTAQLDSIWTYQSLPDSLKEHPIVILNQEVQSFITMFSPDYKEKIVYYINGDQAGENIQEELNSNLNRSNYKIYVYKPDGTVYGLDDENAITQKLYEGRKFTAAREKFILPKLSIGDNLVLIADMPLNINSFPVYNEFFTLHKTIDITVDAFYGYTFINTVNSGKVTTTKVKDGQNHSITFENLEARSFEVNSIYEERKGMVKVLLNAFGSKDISFAIFDIYNSGVFFGDYEKVNNQLYAKFIKEAKKKSANVITQLNIIDRQINAFNLGDLSQGSRRSYGNMILERVIPKKSYLFFMAKTLQELDIKYNWGFTKSKFVGPLYSKSFVSDDNLNEFLVFYDYENQPHYIFAPSSRQYYRIDEIPFQYEGSSAFILEKTDEGVMYGMDVKIIALPVTEDKFNYAKNNLQINIDLAANQAQVDYKLFTSGILTQELKPDYQKWSKNKGEGFNEHGIFESNQWKYSTTIKDSSHYFYPFKYEGEWKMTLEEPTLQLDDSLYQISLEWFDFILTTAFTKEERQTDVLFGHVSKQSARLIFVFDQPISLENAKDLTQEYVFEQGKVEFNTQQINETTISVMINFIQASPFTSKENYHHLYQQRKEYISMLNKSLLVKLK